VLIEMARRAGPIVTAASRTTRLLLLVGMCAVALVFGPAAQAHHSITYTLVGTPGANGWFRSDVTIQWSISHPGDLTSTMGCEPGTRVTTEGTTTRTCSATAGDHTVSLSVNLKIDKTPPAVPTAAPARVPDSNGWYNRAVGVAFTSTDDVSGMDGGCTSGVYAGPDSAAASVATTCTDKAGNVRLGSFSLQYDATAPGVAAAASRAPDANGWYNHALSVTFSQSPGDLSGPGSCSAPVTYGGPDSSSASVSGTCTDRAGNTSQPLGFAIRYDSTPPNALASADRAPDANGWFNRSLTISFAQAAGDLSGPDSCSAAIVYGGPDTAAASRSGTCVDRAGNRSAAASFAFKYDATAPQAVASASRAADVNGWYNRPLTVSFAQAAGDLSGADTCTAPVLYQGPDGASVSRSGTCVDMAGNRSPPATLAFKYDATAPQALASANRAPDANGWFNRAVTISFAQAPGDVSGAGTCSAAVTYGGPDAASASRSGTCTDGAGNQSAAAAYGFKYDATPPVAIASAARAPDANGWFNRPVAISFTQAAGDLSGADTCSPQVTYGGPDAVSIARSGTCTDQAGNRSAAASFAFKYDATAPTASATLARPADANGWHNHPVALEVTGTDALSGIAACGGEPYAGPDGRDRVVSGTCTDAAGNVSAPATQEVDYDATGPVADAVLARPPDVDGWYNRAVDVSVSGTDATSGLASCVGATYSGPDGPARTAPGACTDLAGNTSAPAAVSLNYDATPPVASVALARPPDGNGWFNHPVAAVGSGADGASGVAGCSSASYGGPDTAAVSLAVSCRDRAGNESAAAHVSLRYDATPPAVTATPDRPPTSGKWYRRAVTVSFVGSDSGSGEVECTPPTRFAGPDGAEARVGGSCRDAAGNRTEASFGFGYDATAPRLGRLRAERARRQIVLSWTRPGDVTTVSLVRTPGVNGSRRSIVYSGPARDFVDKKVRVGVPYRYELQAADAAGNVGTATAKATARPTLYQPSNGAAERAPVVLKWEAQKGASFYNVQLVRAGVKVLSAWPRGSTLRLGRAWTYAGERRTLAPGLYRWYVWPATGTRARPVYGRALGSSTFRVRR
jgi:large repetitive protein